MQVGWLSYNVWEHDEANDCCQQRTKYSAWRNGRLTFCHERKFAKVRSSADRHTRKLLRFVSDGPNITGNQLHREVHLEGSRSVQEEAWGYCWKDHITVQCSLFTFWFGYKMCLRVYLNGDGFQESTHLSFFLTIMKGSTMFCWTGLSSRWWP